jgi:hypothetical protein
VHPSNNKNYEEDDKRGNEEEDKNFKANVITMEDIIGKESEEDNEEKPLENEEDDELYRQ